MTVPETLRFYGVAAFFGGASSSLIIEPNLLLGPRIEAGRQPAEVAFVDADESPNKVFELELDEAPGEPADANGVFIRYGIGR